jgi:FHS family L-fucose permease-like MFS transporter
VAIPSVRSSSISSPAQTNTNTRAMVVVTSLFFMWGFVTCLNDILIPHLKAIFDLSYFQVMFVQTAFFSGYFIFSLPSGRLIEWIGYKGSMVAGLCVMALGTILFLPAANIPAFAFFLAALMIVAAGMTILQVSANPYVSVLGPPEGASSRLNLTQAFNSLGTFVAPFFGGVLILSTVPMALDQMRQLDPAALLTYRLHEAATVKFPYLLITAVLLALAFAISRFHLPRIESAEHVTEADRNKPLPKLSSQTHLLLGAVAIFVYVGAEVSIGSFLVNYFKEPSIGNLIEKTAAFLVSFYWGGAMVGRFIGAAVLRKAKPGVVLGIAALVSGALTCASMLTFGYTAVVTIILVGLFNSIMFPTIFTLGIAGLGPLTGRGSSLLIAAILGGAIIPAAQGLIADRIGIHHAFILPVICYLYIVFYGFRGSRPPSRTVVPV